MGGREERLGGSERAIAVPMGTEIGRFRVKSQLGAGGAGVVYVADDSELRREVALKFLPPALSESEQMESSLLSEARAMAAIQHPNVVTIFDLGRWHGRTFIAMEYVKGGSLREELDCFRPDLSKTLSWSLQICAGLARIHSAGFTHCDIKPSNILITSDQTVKITDFGISQLRDMSLSAERDLPSGTPAYMSPEQALGETPDPRSDIFSLGIVIYQMITGRLPFNGAYEAAYVYAIVNTEPPPLSSLSPECPGSVQTVIDNALKKDRTQRYQSVTQLAEDLTHIQQSRFGGGKPATASERAAVSIAVLPFVDMSPQRDQEYFCEGMSEEVINALIPLRGLRVTPRASALRFRNREFDMRTIGRELGVDTILDGSVRKSGSNLRITARLICIADGAHLWSESFERELQDIFAIQDEIARAVALNLKLTLDSIPQRRLVARHTHVPEAYNCYLKGLYFWNKRYHGGLQKATAFFQSAIELDPTYAKAYAGIADVFNILGFYNYLPPHDACPKAKAAIEKALEIDNDLVEARTANGWVHTFYDWDWDTAEREFEQSLSLNSKYSMTHHYYALLLIATGRIEEGLDRMRRAVSSDPLSLIINASYGGILYFARDYAESYKQLRYTLDLDPAFAIAHAYYAGPCTALGRTEEAVAACESAVRLSDGGLYALSMLGFSYASAGMKKKAEEVLIGMLDTATSGYASSYHIALIYTGLGDHGTALAYLEKALAERDNWMVWLAVYPAFDPLRRFDRFRDLINEVGLSSAAGPKVS